MISKLPEIAVVTITREFACACAGHTSIHGSIFRYRDRDRARANRHAARSEQSLSANSHSGHLCDIGRCWGRPSFVSRAKRLAAMPAHSRSKAGTRQSSRLRGFINNARATRVDRAAWLNDDACLRWQPDLVLPGKTIDTYARNREPRHGEFQAVLRPRAARERCGD